MSSIKDVVFVRVNRSMLDVILMVRLGIEYRLFCQGGTRLRAEKLPGDYSGSESCYRGE